MFILILYNDIIPYINIRLNRLYMQHSHTCEKDTEHGFGFPLPPPQLSTPPPPEVPLEDVTMAVAVVTATEAAEEDFWTALFWF